MTYQDSDATKKYRECWRRAIFDATGDNAKALRALELADINGLFEPLAEIDRLRGHLSAAGINLTTAGIVARKLGSDADADLIGKMADQVLVALDGDEQIAGDGT